MVSFRRPSVATALLYASIASASPIQYCPNGQGGVCFQVAIPEASASSGSGNIYFQISAPTSYSWIALGTGSSMSGSNMFVMYQDGSGNLTLSPRLGKGHNEPKLDTSSTAAQLTLLAGSGVSADGTTMTANVACSNCQSWSGGSMSLSSTSAGWIGAWKSGGSLTTSSQSASISQHDGTTSFSLDLTKATVNSDTNPFVASTDSGNNGGNGNNNSGSDGNSPNTGGVVVNQNELLRTSTQVAHGIIMSLVMVVLYPIFSILMPVLGKWWAHGLAQTASFILMWVGFGLGVKLQKDTEGSKDTLRQPHTGLGTAVTALFCLQPIFGYLHHLRYVKTHSRSVVSHVHIWYGRLLMILGVINGGIGLALVDEEDKVKTAYAVVAAVVGVAYIAIKGFLSFTRRRRQPASGSHGQKAYESDSPAAYHNSHTPPSAPSGPPRSYV